MAIASWLSVLLFIIIGLLALVAGAALIGLVVFLIIMLVKKGKNKPEEENLLQDT